LNLLWAGRGKLLASIEIGGFYCRFLPTVPRSLPYILVISAVAKPVIHISEMEAASDFAGLMAKVRAGSEVVIEHDAVPVAIVRPVERRPRLLSEAIALAEASGCTATLDEGFSHDLESIVDSHREPLSPPQWE
jgi:antitoxin (DNA-binding transcriptional repressor) of toxin-antitoxin stability system